MKRLVYGVGIYKKGKFSAGHRVGGENKHTKEYNLWNTMLQRCCCDKFKLKEPTYKDCTVSENFKNFQYFAEWCNQQIGFGVIGYQLDKDILFKGNKHYSEDTCVFVPNNINMLLVSRKAKRGSYPVGTYFDARYSKYCARVCIGKGVSKGLGTFISAMDAFLAYKVAKEGIVKTVVEEYKDQIDPRVYNALMNYEVEITD